MKEERNDRKSAWFVPLYGNKGNRAEIKDEKSSNKCKIPRSSLII